MRLALKPQRGRIADGPALGRGRQGAVLLEVVLALALFVAAASVLTTGLNASLDSVERLRSNTRAADLAVTVMSELQLGLRSASLSGAQQFEPPREGWTWEVVAQPVETGLEDEAGPFKQIEVIIRHTEPAVVYRLTEILRLSSSRTGEDERPGIDSFSGSVR